MNLAIDVGNNQTKIGIFDGDRIRQYQNYHALTLQDVKELFDAYPIKNSILADVAFYESTIDDFLRRHSLFIKLTPNTPLPFVNKYLTPDTLGKDRMALAAAAVDLFPYRDVLVIDAGTCLTYEMVNQQQEYLGGSISPGLSMRLKALHHFTAQLPLIKKEHISYLIGKDTQQSILSGVINGMAGEINYFISEHHKLYPELTVLLTGGDAPFFETRINYRIFAVPHLVLRGLNKILLHNAG